MKRVIFVLSLFSIFLTRCNNHNEGDNDKLISSLDSLSGCIDQAWDVSWDRFYNKDTHQFYDYLTSYNKGDELAHLPTADEVSRQYPNVYGYGTGMEDCMISAGVMMCMIVDKYAVTKDEKLRDFAYSVFK